MLDALKKNSSIGNIMFFLFVSPLCIYLQTMFFATTNIYSTIYIFVTVFFLLILSNCNLSISTDVFTLFLFICIFCFFAFQSDSFLLIIQMLLLTTFLLSKHAKNDFDMGFAIFEYWGIILAFSAFFQVIFYDVYNIAINILFKKEVVFIIKALYFWDHSVCGFSPQTSHTAGYVLNSLLLVFWGSLQKINLRFVLKITLLFTILLLTNKRSFFLFGLISFCFTIFLFEKNNLKIRKIVILATIIFILSVVVYFIIPYLNPEGTFASLLYTFENINNDNVDVTSERSTFAKAAIDLIPSAFWLGHGFGYFKSIYGTDVHNVYLQLLLENGFFVFSIYIFTIFMNLYKSVKTALTVANTEYPLNQRMVALLKFSVCYQIFYILYSFTGNCLYNIDFFSMYIVSVAFVFFVRANYGVLYEKEISYNH